MTDWDENWNKLSLIIEFRASSDFVDRLEELSASMKISKAEVIRVAIDTLEMVAAADRKGRGITFVLKDLNTIENS